MSENSTYFYRGKTFKDAVEYANFILECDKQDKAKAEQERLEQLKFEQNARKSEVEKAYTEYLETYNKSREKYNELVRKYKDDFKIVSVVKPTRDYNSVLEKLLYEFRY